MRTRLCLLFPLLLMAAGCSTTVTNLTPSQLTRDPNGLYPFSVMLDTRQQSIRRETIKPYVIIGLESYPMQATPRLKNRWETLVPIPANQNRINYHYKFDYDYSSIPQPRSSSKLSPPYQLHILEK